MAIETVRIIALLFQCYLGRALRAHPAGAGDARRERRLKGRGLGPSSTAMRAAALAAFLREEVLTDVGHARWVFSIPKMLRPYFPCHRCHRPLLGRLCQAACRTAHEMISAAAPAGETLLPDMIAVVQAFGDDSGWHPHIPALVPRGGWDVHGDRVPVPFVDGEAAALVLSHRARTASNSVKSNFLSLTVSGSRRD